ncbi:MAG: AAA family ATPase, partial [Myxococcota bacterium]|nr:AAA family ATPase [Myxococcota bacterium]
MPPTGAARPAWPRFADVIGQREAIWRIQAAAAAGRLHHALLLDGPAGCGKTSIAIALAAALFCRNRPAAPAPPPPVRSGAADPIAWPLEACGSCASCRKMPAHPDLSLLEVRSDKARISIEQAREATAGIGFRPHEAAWRAIVVREADRLSEPAANALLKSIEEPREGNIFVLATARPAYVQPTIRSRCFRVPLRALDPATVRRLLAERRPDAPPEALDLAAG